MTCHVYCCAVLCCAVLCCAVLCCQSPHHPITLPTSHAYAMYAVQARGNQDQQDRERERQREQDMEGGRGGGVVGGSLGPLQFLIVMHQSKMLSFKGLYLASAEPPPSSHNRSHGDSCIYKLTGRGPKQLPLSLITEYFKYESSSRSFRKLPTVSLTSICDAVSIDPTKLKKSSSALGSNSKKQLY